MVDLHTEVLKPVINKEPRINIVTPTLKIDGIAPASSLGNYSHDVVKAEIREPWANIVIVDGVGMSESDLTVHKDRIEAEKYAEFLLERVNDEGFVETLREKTLPFSILQLENKKGMGANLKFMAAKDCVIIAIHPDVKGEYNSESIDIIYYNPLAKDPQDVKKLTHAGFYEPGSMLLTMTDGGLQTLFSDDMYSFLEDDGVTKIQYSPEEQSAIDNMMLGLLPEKEGAILLKNKLETIADAANNTGIEEICRSILAGASVSRVPDDHGIIGVLIK